MPSHLLADSAGFIVNTTFQHVREGPWGVLVMLKLYWAPDIVEFVLGRFSHFNIAIAYSNSTFCGTWTPGFCEFTQIFSKTSTPQFSEIQVEQVWTCPGELGPCTATPANRQTDTTENITFTTPLPDIKPQPLPKASRLSCLLIQWFSIRSAQIEKWFQCLEFRPTLFSRLSCIELFTVDNLFGNFKWLKCLNKFKSLVSHINGQIKPAVFVV